MKKKYPVILTPAQRDDLLTLIGAGVSPARQLLHARILLKADQSPDGPGWVDDEIADAVEVSQSTVARVRRQFTEDGLEAVLNRRASTRSYARRLDGEHEAHLVALCCGEPPAGAKRWSLRLLADRLVELEIVEAVSHETIRRTLKKNDLKPWLKRQWCIPPQASAEFVWRMEEVLSVYTRPYDPRFPQVCLDETSKQLLRDVRDPLPLAPATPIREDAEYARGGVANMFMVCEPLAGQRWVTVTEHRTKRDWAQLIKTLVDDWYPDAERIVLVQDNLNTHTPAALYDAFAPAEAKRLIDKIEWHYTPKHGSWLNMAEIELSVLTRQCLDQRIPDIVALEREVAAWITRRTAHGTGIDWRFTTADARIKLKRLYPSLQP